MERWEERETDFRSSAWGVRTEQDAGRRAALKCTLYAFAWQDFFSSSAPFSYLQLFIQGRGRKIFPFHVNMSTGVSLSWYCLGHVDEA